MSDSVIETYCFTHLPRVRHFCLCSLTWCHTASSGSPASTVECLQGENDPTRHPGNDRNSAKFHFRSVWRHLAPTAELSTPHVCLFCFGVCFFFIRPEHLCLDTVHHVHGFNFLNKSSPTCPQGQKGWCDLFLEISQFPHSCGRGWLSAQLIARE